MSKKSKISMPSRLQIAKVLSDAVGLKTDGLMTRTGNDIHMPSKKQVKAWMKENLLQE